MLLPTISQETQEQLDWPLLLEALRSFAETAFAEQQIITNQLFLPNAITIQQHLHAVSDLRQIIERAGDISTHF